MKVREAHLFFEQSGVFKNEFKKIGIPAKDYDIQNDFGETDCIIDLFAEIEKAYDGEDSIFDLIKADDLIMAFFPCIYFEALQMTYYMNESINLRKLDKKSRYDNIINRSKNRERFYILLYKLVAICDIKALRLIIENPAVQPNYIMFPMNFLKPTFIDQDRSLRGDFYHKPTAYWFINCNPTYGLSVSPNRNTKRIMSARKGKKSGICSMERSMISPTYARNFICDFILGKENENSVPTLKFEYD